MNHRRFSRVFLAAALAFGIAPQLPAFTNNLALTPQMGWNDWNSYHCNISESAVTNTASILANNGMKAAGYQYINIDDGWAGTRDSNGVIEAYDISGKFPHGIKWLADYVHSKGFKLGLYTDHGTNTCSQCIDSGTNPIKKQPGSFMHEYIDAFTYAQWGADYLKNDSCNLPPGDVAHDDYFRMADGMMKSGRPLFASLCENAPHYEYWSPDVGNSWRTTGDIGSTFSSMIGKVDQNSRSAYVAGPGRWNDPDMLEIGNGDFATDLVAAQTHFTLWCEMAAPLLAGNNVSTMSAASLAILTNTEAIAVDQDPAGEQGVVVGGSRDNAEVWSKPLGYDFTTRAVVLLNRSTTSSANITCNWTNLAFQAGTTATVRDLWAHKDLGTFTDSFTTNVPPEGTVFLKIVGTPIAPPVLGTNYLSARQPIYSYVYSNNAWRVVGHDKTIAGKTLTLDGVTYTNGLGACAVSGMEYNLGGVCSRFRATIGVDDEVGSSGSVIFQVFADGRKIYDSGIMTGSTTAKVLDLDMTGVRRLTLGVTDTGSDTSPGSGSRDTKDDADWANARVIVTNTTPQVPDKPTGLTSGPGKAITLTWNDTLAGLTYNVKRSTTNGGPYTTITNVPITTFTDTNVGFGTNYYYVVSAVSSIGEGSNSLQTVAAPCDVPSAPTNVVATPGVSQIAVTWNASPGATSYNVFRFTGSTPPVLIAPGLTATNYTDGSLPGNSTNYYLVTAANSCNESGYSYYAAGATPPGPPGVPTGLSATPGNGLADLTWDAAVNATGYNLKRSTTNGGPYAIIATNISATSYLDVPLNNGTTYYYVVSAVNTGGESGNSSQTSVTPSAPVTAYWTNTVTASAQNWNANANWTNASVFPNAVGELAIVNAGLTAPQTIRLNQSITIGALEIGDANGLAGYTLSANGGSLAFDDASPVSITQLASSRGDVLATPVSILNDLIVINNSANPLTLAGPLTGSGSAAVTIGSGALQVGDGTTDGDLGSVNVTNNGALIFNCSGSITPTGVISGSGSLTNNGTGTVTLNVVENYTGETVVNAGTLVLNAGNSANSTLASSSALTINSNGVVQVGIDNSLAGHGNIGVLPVTINAGGVLTGMPGDDSGAGTSTHLQGLLTLNGGTLDNSGTSINTKYGSWDLDDGVAVNSGPNYGVTSTIACLSVIPSQSGGTVFNVADGGTPGGIDLLVTGTLINGTSIHDTGIIKNGNGTMALANVNSYTGSTYVNGGTLALTGSGNINSSAQVAVNNATFDLSGLSAAACANSQFSLTDATLVLAIPATATTNEATTTLTLGGTTNVINITSLPAISSYPARFHLISYSTLSGTFNIGLGLLPTAGGTVVTGYVANAGGFVDLVVNTNGAAPRQLSWTGADSSNPHNWDAGVSQNWNSNGIATVYNQGDDVRFDDTASGQTNVYLMDILSPNSLTVSNSALIYNLGAGGTGGGRISGATGLLKQGTNVLILDENNASGSYNDFSGGVTINEGTVQVGNGDSAGDVGTGPVVDNGALVFNRSDVVTNSSTISGSGSVAQNGTGVLTLSGANSFNGGVMIQNGTLSAGNASALGSTSGATVITNGGTLDVNGNNLGSEQIFVSGWGANSNGAIVSTASASQLHALQNVTLTGDTAFGGPGDWLATGNPGRWDIRNAGTTLTMAGGQPFNLYKVGNNQMSFVTTTIDTNLANIDIQQGMLGFEAGSTSMGNPASNLIVRAGATLEFYQGGAVSNTYTKQFILYGGATPCITNWPGGGSSTIYGQMTLNGDCTIGVNGTSFTNNCTIIGSGSLIKGGPSPLALGGVNTYAGGTTVAGGTLYLMNNGSISSSSNINVNAGATLDAGLRNDGTLTVAGGQTLTGNGLVNGNAVIAGGATLAPGGSLTTLTFNNNLTLNTGSKTSVELNKTLSTNDAVQVNGTLTYGGTLMLTNLSGTLSAGDSFKLFNAGGYTGAFAGIAPAIPGINLAWNTNNLGSGILSVVASPTAPPKFKAMAASGNNLVFNGTNGVPGWPYYVLAATNVSLPWTNWSVIATNQFDANGHFDFTNPINPAMPETYYLLKLQ